MNWLCGTVSLSEPPTSAPSAMRQVLFVSPSQPLNVWPSKMGTALAGSAAWAAIMPSKRRMRARDRFIIEAWCCCLRISAKACPVERGFRSGSAPGTRHDCSGVLSIWSAGTRAVCAPPKTLSPFRWVGDLLVGCVVGNMDDAELLMEYAVRGSEAAFRVVHVSHDVSHQ